MEFTYVHSFRVAVSAFLLLTNLTLVLLKKYILHLSIPSLFRYHLFVDKKNFLIILIMSNVLLAKPSKSSGLLSIWENFYHIPLSPCCLSHIALFLLLPSFLKVKSFLIIKKGHYGNGSKNLKMISLTNSY